MNLEEKIEYRKKHHAFMNYVDIVIEDVKEDYCVASIYRIKKG